MLAMVKMFLDVVFAALATGSGLNNSRATLHFAAIAAMEDLDMPKHVDRKEIAYRHGGFGDYVVDGTLWEYSDGRKIWWIVIVSPTSGRPEVEWVNLACRVSGEDIRCVKVDIQLPEFGTVTGDDLVRIDPVVKEAIRAAIRKWSDEMEGA